MLAFGNFYCICCLFFKMDASKAIDIIMEDDSDSSDVNESSDKEY